MQPLVTLICCLFACRRYNWYDSNYGSTYTARKEEHVSRILGSRFHLSSEDGEEAAGDEDDQDDTNEASARILRADDASHLMSREDGMGATGVPGTRGIKEPTARKQKSLAHAIFGSY